MTRKQLRTVSVDCDPAGRDFAPNIAAGMFVHCREEEVLNDEL